MEFEVVAGKDLITVDEGEEEGAGWNTEELGVVDFNSFLGIGCIGRQSISLQKINNV